MNILFLTSNYLPNPSANGINSRNIIEELKKRGHKVTCISVQQEHEKDYEVIDNTEIYRLPPSPYSRLIEKYANSKNLITILRMLRALKLMLLLYDFPNHDPGQAKRIMHKMQELHNKNNFDLIIGIHKPYANIAALLKFKRKNPTIKCISYYLDLTNSHSKPKLMPHRLYERLCFRADMGAFKILNLSLIAKSGARYYEHEDYARVREKIEYVDFPTFIINDVHGENPMETEPKKNSVTSLVFAGTLDRDYRNPKYLLECLMEASKGIGIIEFHIYGRGNCDDIIDKYTGLESLRVIKHGFAGHDTIIEALTSAHVLVNISNSIEDAVPSKIFELFSTGKPIINVLFRANDPVIDYFKRYPGAISIGISDINEDAAKIYGFIKTPKGINHDVSYLKEAFVENTPEYIVDIIENRSYPN